MKSGEDGLIGPGSNNYGRNNSDSNGESETLKIQVPTCGRIVHYVPVLPDVLRETNPQYCKLLPAIVVEASDLYANLVVFSMGSTPADSNFSVPHKSLAHPNQSYWQWPNEK
jgi:hypothetical protein